MGLERWRHVVPLRIRSLFRRPDVDRELDDELRYHIDRQIELNIEQGMTAAEARTAALRGMGGVEIRKEECRDQRGLARLDNTLRDLRHAVRLLRRSPVFTAVAVCSLAVGIGANAAIFQLIDLVQLRRLPIVHPQELAEVRVNGVKNFGVSDGFTSEITYPLWEQIRDHHQAFTGVFAWGRFQPLAGRGAEAQRVRALWATGDFFSVLGVAPERGRLLAASDDWRGCGAGAVVVSHAFWQRYFGGQDSAIGSRLPILDQSFTVVGVTPASFTGLEVGRTFDVVVPVCSAAMWGDALDQRHYWWLTVMGRLRPGWTLAQASDHMQTISPRLIDATVPSGYSAESTARYRAFRLGALPAGRGVSRLRTEYGTSLWLLLGMTGLVLLITCGNLATLMLARASAREREVTLRVAIGASRRRIVSQLLVESLLIGGIGAALSIPVALLSSRALVMFLTTTTNPVHLNLSPDWRVVSFASLVAVLTSILFGLVPALRLSLVSPNGVLRQAARGLTVDRGRSAFQRALVVGQIAISLVLVVSALLFVRSFWNLLGMDTGFQQERVLSVAFLDLAPGRLSMDQRIAFQQALADEIGATPGVIAAASSTHVPLNGAAWSQAFRLTDIAPNVRKGSRLSYVGPGYFDTLGIPLVAGRQISRLDSAASRRVMVVNEAFVRTHLDGVTPLGTRLRTFAEPGYPETTYEIVGVVRDTVYSNVRDGKPPIAFVPIAQHPSPRPWAGVLVRASGPTAGVIARIKARVAKLKPGMTAQASDLGGQIREGFVGQRMLAWLAGALSALATTLAAVGLFGLIAYLSTGRRNEIGIRLSLGSTRGQIIALMLRDSVWLVGLGLALGLPAAFLVIRGVSSLLFGVSPTSQILVGAAMLLATVAAVSGGIPAWRASRLNPIVALRCE
jgi:predicted permease